MLADEEVPPSAHAYQKGNYLIFNNTLYKVTAAIAIGDVLSTSTNIAAVKVGEELKATAGTSQGESIIPPTLTTSSFTYDGTSKSPVFTGFNSDTMTILNSSATNAGQYTVVVTLTNPADT